MSRLHLWTDEIVSGLKSRAKVQDLAQEIAMKAGVTPGQVILYIAAMSERN